MFYGSRLGWPATGLALLVSLGCAKAERGEAQASEPEAYVLYAREEALQRAGGEGRARVLSAAFGRLARGYPIVCGTVSVDDEEVSFATLWRPDESVEDGATVVSMTRSNTAKYGDAFAVQNAKVCAEAGLTDALPQGVGR